MKLKTLLLAFIAFVPASLWAQWTVLSSGTSKDLNAVHFANNTTGWVTGKDGVLLKTTNAGNSWTSLSSGTTKEINSIFFINASTGWIAGKDGVIRKTTDGGTTWTAQSSGTSKKITAIHFINETNGVAVAEEGITLTTSNGGTTWVAHSTGFRPASGSGDDEGTDLYDVQMVSTSVVYAAGKKGVFAKSTNGGISWSKQTTAITTDINALHFPSSGKGYFVSEEGRVRVTDGNGTFTSATANTSKDVLGVYFINDNKGWIVGEEGRILHTTNGGSSWITQNLSNMTRDLKDVFFADANTGFAVGKSGTILKSNGSSDGATAINEVENNFPISIAPNPVSDFVQLQWPAIDDVWNVQVADMTGKQIWQAQTNAKQNTALRINTASWSNGIYLLHIKGRKVDMVQKIVK